MSPRDVTVMPRACVGMYWLPGRRNLGWSTECRRIRTLHRCGVAARPSTECQGEGPSKRSNIASLYESHQQGRYNNAEALYEKVLAVDERKLGVEHSAMFPVLVDMREVLHGRQRVPVIGLTISTRLHRTSACPQLRRYVYLPV
jgi:Tetratricopeptide repeat